MTIADAHFAIWSTKSDTSAVVADSGLAAIDRFFDVIDDVVDKTDRVLNRTRRTEDQHRARRAKRADVDTAPSIKVRGRLQARRFEIIEAIAAETGSPIFVVTNGEVRAECSTRALAEKVLCALETAP